MQDMLERMRNASEVRVATELGYPRPIGLSVPESSPEVEVGTDDKQGLALNVSVSLPGLALLHVCFAHSSASPPPPSKPAHLRAHLARPVGYTHEKSAVLDGSSLPAEVVLKWDSVPERCIKTYSVSYRESKLGSASRINPDSVFTSFLHALPQVVADGASREAAPTQACYTVAAVDYWGQAGPSSEEVCVYAL